MTNFSEEQLRDARLAEYREVAQNFRTLTDIRFRLLSFLPVGTALIALSSAWSKNEVSTPLSLFGLAVTLALIVYNERNDQLYDELVQRAAQLERRLGLQDGHFSHRPAAWLKIHPMPNISVGEFPVPIEHGRAIGIIYRASVVAWLFMLFSPIFGWLSDKVLPQTAFDVSVAVPLSTLSAIITAIYVGVSFFNWFESQKIERRKNMRALATRAVSCLAGLTFPPKSPDLAKWEKLFSCAVHLRGGECEEEFNTVLQHARFYLSKELTRTDNIYYPLPSLTSSVFGPITAAHVIALLTDLPARWLLDVHFGRRGTKQVSDEEENKPNNERTKERLEAIKEWLQENETYQTCNRSDEGNHHSSDSSGL